MRLPFRAKEPDTGIGLCISYPKSGRTWLRVMLDDLACPLDYTHGGSALHHQKFRNPGDFLGKRRVLFLHRDPIDTTVSGYFQVTKREAWRNLFDGTISEFVRSPLGISRTLQFNSIWLAAASKAGAMITTYEALHADAPGELQRIAAWFGTPISDQQVAHAIEAGRFDTMKARETADVYKDQYDHRLRPADASDQDSFKVRKGIVGGYRQYLSDEDVEFCAKAIRNTSVI